MKTLNYYSSKNDFMHFIFLNQLQSYLTIFFKYFFIVNFAIIDTFRIIVLNSPTFKHDSFY